MKKKTISNEISFSGIGLHTGEKATIRIVPSEEGNIKFIKNGTEILAHYRYVVETRRGVVLKKDGDFIQTVEHLLSALWGMQIDGAKIIIEEGSEIPAMDGSALPFAEEIYEAGYRLIDKDLEYISCKKLDFKNDGKEITLVSSEKPQITYFIDFKEPIGKEVFLAPLDDAEFYLKEIAPARTFIFDFEVEYVKKLGIAKGGSLENTVVFKKDGIYNEGLRFKDEPVRHKILDFIGDSALLGKRIKQSVFVKKAGHTEHITFIKKLEECYES